MVEKTFVMIKPDGVTRGLSGEIIHRLERKGLKIVSTKMIQLDEKLAKEHYKEHQGKEFFNSLVEFITTSPSLAMVIEGEDAISVVRTLVGATNPKEAQPGTIRGDFGLKTQNNIVHASDSQDSAKREISLFFDRSEEHTSELQSHSFISYAVFCLKKKNQKKSTQKLYFFSIS